MLPLNSDSRCFLVVIVAAVAAADELRSPLMMYSPANLWQQYNDVEIVWHDEASLLDVRFLETQTSHGCFRRIHFPMNHFLGAMVAVVVVVAAEDDFVRRVSLDEKTGFVVGQLFASDLHVTVVEIVVGPMVVCWPGDAWYQLLGDEEKLAAHSISQVPRASVQLKSNKAVFSACPRDVSE